MEGGDEERKKEWKKVREKERKVSYNGTVCSFNQIYSNVLLFQNTELNTWGSFNKNLTLEVVKYQGIHTYTRTYTNCILDLIRCGMSFETKRGRTLQT